MLPILKYADNAVLPSQSPSGLQQMLDVLQAFCSDKLVSVKMAETQGTACNDFCRVMPDVFKYGAQ